MKEFLIGNIDDYITKILSKRRFAVADLFTFTLVTGDVDRFSNLDFNLTFGGHTYKANSLIIEGLQYKTSTGFTVDEKDVKITFRPTDTLAGSVFIEAVTEGLLDGATILRQRAFWEAYSDVAMFDYIQGGPDFLITLFTGNVSSIDKIGRTSVELKVASPMKLLDLDMPRNNYQSGCQWSLFDQGCTLSRSAYTITASIASLEGDYGIEVSGGVPISVGDDGDPYYAEGRIHFTSGARSGLQLTLRTNSDTHLYFMYPPITGLEVGDTFDFWPGCSKRVDTCSKKFNNLQNRRGFDKVPPIHISV
jgi:uncharacterized phage protein (TIGR02218 family)